MKLGMMKSHVRILESEELAWGVEFRIKWVTDPLYVMIKGLNPK